MSTARGRNRLMEALVKRYGQEKADTIYAQMRGRAQGPFALGNELHQEHVDWALGAGVAPITKKPPASLPGASPFKRRR